MATLAQIKTAIDNWLAGKWVAFQARQDAYFALRGRYFQGKITHAAVPESDGQDVTADNLNDAPHYQSEKWADFWPAIPAALPCQLECHQYRHEGVYGYVAYVRVKLPNGDIYQRAAQVGPATYLAHAWQQIN